ncbi:MAG: tRNA dihydrouridine synthase DusB [Candidatus Kapaibacterium sp.]
MKIGDKINIERGLLLAPMEGITDLPFRIICRRLGADIVYSEFIASEALIRDAEKSKRKMEVVDSERPVAVQIFGSDPEVMARSAQMVEAAGADILDINFGCWVKKVVNNLAGAALLKDLDAMARITEACANAVSIPVTVKTRLGWDKQSIVIEDAARRIESAGARALAVHCRTRDMAMRGEADWSWIPRIKGAVSIPVILNGDVRTPEDAGRAFAETGCDAVMIGRAAVGNPFLFKKARRYLETGEVPPPVTVRERIEVCLEHLRLTIEYKGFPRGMYEFRKHYSGYLRGLYDASAIRRKLVEMEDLAEIERTLGDYYEYLVGEDRLEPHNSSAIPKITKRKT